MPPGDGPGRGRRRSQSRNEYPGKPSAFRSGLSLTWNRDHESLTVPWPEMNRAGWAVKPDSASPNAPDLLRKSGLESDTVAECSNKVDPKVKPAPVAVGSLQNAEDLEPPYQVLYGQSCPCQLTIVCPLGVGERVMRAGLLRSPDVRVLVLNPLISGVSEEFGVRMDGRVRLPQESKIIRRPAARSHTEALARYRMNQEL